MVQRLSRRATWRWQVGVGWALLVLVGVGWPLGVVAHGVRREEAAAWAALLVQAIRSLAAAYLLPNGPDPDPDQRSA